VTERVEAAARGAEDVSTVPPHPSEFSPEVLDVVADLIRPGEHVHDPYGGRGLRLGALCDRLGATFTATDIEAWPGADPRVALGDSDSALTYPLQPFTVVTSPTYVNKRLSDYAKVGPLPTTQLRGRRDYAISLGHAVHPDSTVLLTGRFARRDGGAAYYAAHARAVEHWGDRVIVNVDEPISDRWQQLLVEHGYRIMQVIPAHTRRYGGLDNADKRAEHEVVIVAARGARALSESSGRIPPHNVEAEVAAVSDFGMIPSASPDAVYHECGDPVPGYGGLRYSRFLLPADACPDCGWSPGLPFPSLRDVATGLVNGLGSG
jgi:hypothetical protein